MTILGGIRTVGTAVLVNIGVGLHVRIEHGLVDTGVIALATFVGFRAKMVSKVVLEMMLVFCHKGALRTLQQLVILDVLSGVLPEFNLTME